MGCLLPAASLAAASPASLVPQRAPGWSGCDINVPVQLSVRLGLSATDIGKVLGGNCQWGLTPRQCMTSTSN